MAEARAAIPAELKRAVLVEAGHRCAIPTCRQTPVELAHIKPWVQVKMHALDNLIALCPTCHTRYDAGDIDRKSMLQYKENLEVLNSRYTEVERQLLRSFAKMWVGIEQASIESGRGSILAGLLEVGRQNTYGFGEFAIHGGMWWLLTNLMEDEIVHLGPYIEDIERCAASHGDRGIYLTAKGLEFVQRLVEAEPL